MSQQWTPPPSPEWRGKHSQLFGSGDPVYSVLLLAGWCCSDHLCDAG